MNNRRTDPLSSDAMEDRFEREDATTDQAWKAVALLLLVLALGLIFNWQDSFLLKKG